MCAAKQDWPPVRSLAEDIFVKASRTKSVLWAVLGGIGLLLVLMLGVLMFDPWSEVNCWHNSIDVVAGRHRYERYLFWVRVVDRVEDGGATLWYRRLIGEPPEPEWHPVITLSPVIGFSPHYVHHHSAGVLRHLEYVLDLPTLTDDARKCVITEFFARLRDETASDSAYEYLDQVDKLAKSRQLLQAADLPEHGK
jgi:hypothetical protein